MKPGQKDIFYITGSSKEQLEKSPFLERLTKKNYEVCYREASFFYSILCHAFYVFFFFEKNVFYGFSLWFLILHIHRIVVLWYFYSCLFTPSKISRLISGIVRLSVRFTHSRLHRSICQRFLTQES